MPGILSAMLAVLLQLAVGLLFAALVCDWRGEVTRGFLFLTAATALLVGLLAFGLAGLVPLTALAGWYLLLANGAPASASGPGGLSGALLWVGAGMITLFPFGVTVAARVCCVDGPGRGRSLQAATGLLYLVAAAVLAGGLAGNAVLLGA